MSTFTESILIDAPPATVWATLAHHQTQRVLLAHDS